MKISGLELTEGSDIGNLTIDSGPLFPENANNAELFYRLDDDARVAGLYIYIDGVWERIASQHSATVPVGTALPSLANTGDTFFLDSGDVTAGFYVHDGTTWGLLTTASGAGLALDAAQITSGSFVDPRISESSVTQHQGALSILETQITDGSLLARVGADEVITGNWSFNNPIVGVDPTGASHFVTKQYADNLISSLDVKQSVRAASTTNITLSGTQTMDGVVLVVGNRVLVKNQSNGAENGLYGVGVGAWSRTTDADFPNEVRYGLYVFVEEGTANSDTGWILSTKNPITLNSTSLTFTQFTGLGQITAGAGLTKTGSVLSINSVSSDRLVIGIDDIDLAEAGTAGSYTLITTDDYGRVITGANPTTLAEYGITDALSLGALNAIQGVLTAPSAAVPAARVLTGTSNQITLTDAGAGGNLTLSLPDAVVLPGTGAFKVPTGTTAQRPGSPTTPALRYNSTLSLYETFTGSLWDSFVQGSDLRLVKANTVSVQKTPGPGEFSTVTDAVAHVAARSPSATNPWVIFVYPGIYTEAAPITVPASTGIFGASASACIIQPAVATNDVFVISSTGSRLEKITVRNATGTNAAGVRITSSVAPTNLNTITITNCYEHLVLESSTTAVLALLQFVRLAAGAGTKNLVRIQAHNNQTTQLRVFVSNFMGTTGGVFTAGAVITGAGALCEFNASSMEGTTTASGVGISLEDGGTVSGFSGVTVSGFQRNVVVNNVGTAPKMQLALSQSVNSGIYDLFIDHPGTTGFFSGVIDKSKIYVDPAAVISLLITQSTSTASTSIIGDLYVGKTFGVTTNIIPQLQEAGPVGILSGGTLSRHLTLADSIVVQAGYGYLKDPSTQRSKYISWGTTNIQLSANGQLTTIFVNTSSVVQGSTSPPNIYENIVLGGAVLLNDTILLIARTQFVANNVATHLDEYLRNVFGPIFASGSIVTENGTPFKLDVTSGLYYLSRNQFTPVGGTAITFLEHQPTGSFLSVDTVNHTQYNNTGTLTAITPGWFVKHALYLFEDQADEAYSLVLAQAEHATLGEAEGAPLPVPPSFFAPPIVLIAGIIVQEGYSTIEQIIDLRPRVGFAASSTSAVSDHGDLSGLLDDDHPQYLLTNGARVLTGDLNFGSNDITSVGLINGVTITSLAARLAPNSGLDPLSTGVGTSISTSTTNTVGTANTLARSDHTHALSGVQPLDSDLTALAAVSTTGLYAITGSGTSATRSLAAPAAGITISNPTAVAGNPTFALANDLGAVEGLSSTGLAVRTGTDTWGTRTLAGTSGRITVANGDGVAGAPTFDLAGAGSAGTYRSVTTDVYGRVTGGSNPTTLSGYGITDAVSLSTQTANFVLAAPSGSSGAPSFRALVAADLPSHTQPWALVSSTPTTIFGYGITDASPAFTGDVTKPLNSTVLTLSNSGVTIGAYTKVTVDAKGRVILGTNPTTLDDYGITDAVPTTYLAVSNGVATLDATGHLSNDQIPTSLIGSVYKGTWNATTNSPTLASGVGTKGDFYIVSVGGSTSIDGTSSWLIGDQIIFSGTVWQRIAGAPSAVSSVAGRTGAIVLAVADVSGAAVNSTVVHNTGTETIAGAKTFSTTIIGSISGNAGTVTTNANLTGDVTSIGNAATLPAVGTPGTYRSVTTDAKGRVTAGTSPTTLAGYGITDASPEYTGDVLKAANSNVLDLLPVGTPGTYQVVTTDDNGRVTSGSNPSTLAGFGIIDGNPAFTGDVTKPLNSTVLTLSTSGVTASTYRSVTVDTKGRVTAGTNPTTIAGYGITDAVGLTLLGAVSGVATLDTGAKVPLAQLPGVAIDAAVLHITGTETITGAKTFSSLITGSVSGNAGTVTTNANLTGDVTSVGNTTTLSSTGVGAGTYKSVTVDTKGRVTAGTNPTTLAGYGITDANPAFTGDVTKAANGTVLTLATTGVGAGTYKSVTVDAKGRVTAGTNPTSLSGYGITDAVSSSLLGAVNGVAVLDSGGKVPLSALPTSGASVFKGTWNASTNTPTIVNGVGTTGEFYAIDTPGSTVIDGTDGWIVGDQIIFNGTIWQKLPGTPSAVASVAGRTGNITLAVADVTGAAADASVLHIAGTETITGAKTFSSLITGSISGNAGTVTTNANLTGDVTSTGNTTTLSSAGTAGTYRSVTTDAKGRVTAGTNPTTLAGYGITDANPAFTGDVTKTTNGTVLTLSSTGVGAGTYRSVTVDVKGRVTAGTSPTTLSGYGITDAVNSSLLGTAAGVATLDGAGTLPAAQVPAALVGASVYKGAWNATTNTPLITDGVGVKGNYYNIASAGSTNIDGNATWLVGDRIIYTGTAWERMEGTPPVITSVAGRTGAITLTKADVTDLVSRTITGTSNQITVTNGDGVAGNPVLSITPNPVLPGTAALTIPVGSTAQRPGTPVAGALRFNSSLVKYENYDGTTWKNVATENFVSAGYQPLDADLTSISAMVSTGLAVNAGAGSWAARTLIPPASGFTITNPDGVSGNPTFALSGDLAAIEALSTTGLLARTGTNTWIPRVLTGSTNQIAITNADGVVGDPTISLAANVIFPGTGSITVPVGTTAQRTVGPVSGAVRYNSTLDKYEFYQSGQWTTAINGVAPGVVPSQMTQLLTGQVPAIAGTNSMPFDNNVPVSTNGMFLFSRSITTSAAGTRILFAFPFWLDTSTNATIIMQVFRNPFTGYQIINIGANKTVASATNYVSGTTYNATITIDGVAKPISLLGSNASTYATLINGINNALGTAGTAMFAGGNLRIVSATSSTTSTVSIVNGSPAMFASPLNGFVSILTAVPGSTPGCLISIPNTITAKGNSSSITIVDTPGTGTFTYTVRVGTNTGTFYINQNAAGNNFGGFNTTSYSLMEVV